MKWSSKQTRPNGCIVRQNSCQSQLTKPHVFSAFVSETASIFNFQESGRNSLEDIKRVEASFWFIHRLVFAEGNGHFTFIYEATASVFLKSSWAVQLKVEGREKKQKRPFFEVFFFNKFSQTFVREFQSCFSLLR